MGKAINKLMISKVPEILYSKMTLGYLLTIFSKKVKLSLKIFLKPAQ